MPRPMIWLDRRAVRGLAWPWAACADGGTKQLINQLNCRQLCHYCTRRVGVACGSQMSRQAGDAHDVVQVPEMVSYVGVEGCM